ncbi:MAG TPA: glycosyltransferase [Acidimicrobiales bacterium]|nr:glycosyltransferase [Acidimicrobiales bacterium]
MADPRVAVVVMTHNRVDELLATLARLSRLPEEPPIVVVDNGSDDGTAEAVRAQFPAVDLVALEANVGAAARNLGVARVDQPYVAFCDDDTWWDPGSLSRAADVFDADGQVAVVTGTIVVEPGGEDDPVVDELRHSPVPSPEGCPGPVLLSFLAGASMIRADAYQAAGGFEPRLQVGGEEALLGVDLAAAGWLMVHIADVVVHHLPSPTRDPHLRRRQGIRNALWFFWLRRPAGAALRRSSHLMATMPRDCHSAAAVAAAVRGLPWVLRNRRVVPAEVEAGLRLLDEPQMHSRARQYVS